MRYLVCIALAWSGGLGCSADPEEDPWVPGPSDDPPTGDDGDGEGEPSMDTGECKTGFADCDLQADNGCEADLSASANCGACGHVCDLPNADSMCAGEGRCAVVGCTAGYADCDEDAATGCELELAESANLCDDAVSMAERISGDTGDDTTAVITGTSSQWLRVRVTEDETWNPYVGLSAHFTLEVPDGVDYDLILWDGCEATQMDTRETVGMGEDEVACAQWGDTFAVSDSRDLWIEVRFRDGSSCQPWSLTAIGHMGCE